ncbi:uncharacterized protein [Rutidosis leptorrhynchoides]|uniref:uncharacterized protein n=1 Tax=Rutidosis leptorrhynchoides TaxID=125765 RepID=UPI003A99E50F
MGLSAKQVSDSDDQTLGPMKESAEGLIKCPRCESSNTKFCYYNNYNKSQPRHFCRNCKRHWTKGGTLRNVPLGGRKNKRPRQRQSRRHTFVDDHQKKMISTSDLYDDPTAGILPSSSSSLQVCPPNFMDCDQIGPSTLNPSLLFPFTFSDSSTSFQNSISSSVYDYNYYNGGGETIMPSSSSSITFTPPSIITDGTIGQYMENYWNWDDLENLISSSTDLNTPWEEDEEEEDPDDDVK